MAKLAAADAGLGKGRAKRKPRRKFLLRVHCAVDRPGVWDFQKMVVRGEPMEGQYVRLEFVGRVARTIRMTRDDSSDDD